jgi:hypothetical protein
MKLKVLIILTVIATVAYYVYQDPKLNQQLFNKIHLIAPELNQSTLYKWKNNQGEWQITDTPPAKGISFTTISTQDQVNVMPSKPNKK